MLALLLLPHFQGAAQPDPGRVESLKKTAIPVRTIDPADTEFSDILPLKRLIGDARIVALGEPGHGDGATFHAKVRLVRFLHEEMGFSLPKDHWLRTPMVAKLLGHLPMSAVWPDHFDALFYIDTMFPSTPYAAPPEKAASPGSSGGQHERNGVTRAAERLLPAPRP